MHAHPWFVRAFRSGVVLGVALGATGCASFSSDGGMNAVDAIAAPLLRTDTAKINTDVAATNVAPRTRQLLNATLSAQAAVRVALLNNRGLQAA